MLHRAVSLLAHVAGNPLAAAVSNVEYARETAHSSGLPAEVRAALDDAGTALQRLRRLLRRVTELVRDVESAPAHERHRLDEVMASAVARARSRRPRAAWLLLDPAIPAELRGEPVAAPLAGIIASLAVTVAAAQRDDAGPPVATVRLRARRRLGAIVVEIYGPGVEPMAGRAEEAERELLVLVAAELARPFGARVGRRRRDGSVRLATARRRCALRLACGASRRKC